MPSSHQKIPHYMNTQKATFVQRPIGDLVEAFEIFRTLVTGSLLAFQDAPL